MSFGCMVLGSRGGRPGLAVVVGSRVQHVGWASKPYVQVTFTVSLARCETTAESINLPSQDPSQQNEDHKGCRTSGWEALIRGYIQIPH